MRVVQEAVEDGIGDRGVTDPAVPVFYGQLCGDDGGMALGAIVHDLEQILPAVRLQGLKRPVIEHQDFDFGESHEATLVDTLAASDAQLLEQAW